MSSGRRSPPNCARRRWRVTAPSKESADLGHPGACREIFEKTIITAQRRVDPVDPCK